MSALGIVAAWLADKVAGKVVDDALTGSRERDFRALRQALIESQNERAELRDAARLQAEVAADRDRMFFEVMRLRIENAELRAEIARLRA